MKQIETILTNIDFDKIHSVMKLLDWEWAFVTREGEIFSGIPSKAQLKKRAKELLEMAYEEKTTMFCGGFIASYDGNENSLSLDFVITGYTSYFESYVTDNREDGLPF